MDGVAVDVVVVVVAPAAAAAVEELCARLVEEGPAARDPPFSWSSFAAAFFASASVPFSPTGSTLFAALAGAGSAAFAPPSTSMSWARAVDLEDVQGSNTETRLCQKLCFTFRVTGLGLVFVTDDGRDEPDFLVLAVADWAVVESLEWVAI